MHRSSPQFPDRTAPVLALLTIVLFALVSACARSTGTSQPEPRVAAPPDTITAADLTSNVIAKRHKESVASMLQGRTSGVLVDVNADGSISVRIRAASSFYAGSEPLYVIDGTPLTPGLGGDLRGIAPDDIESIEVLKYPPETSLYGVRGANGVIVITTRRPRR